MNVDESEQKEKVYMSDLIADMFEQQDFDEGLLSVNAAFVCLLHLGNEKKLNFQGLEDDDLDMNNEDEDMEKDFIITK